MKLSSKTIDVLKNFASINTNILVREGDVLRTISTGKSVFAKATVAETFPKEFAIYDLNTLLSIISLEDDHDIEFGEKSMKITQGGDWFEYYYSSPAIVVAAPNKDIECDEFYTFALTKKDVQKIVKAASVIGAATITVKSDADIVTLVVGDRKEDTANSFSKNIGASSEAFECHIAVTNFLLMADDYAVTISKKKLIRFASQNVGVEYFVAMEPDSKI